jgi:PAS domain S-box-containing protein
MMGGSSSGACQDMLTAEFLGEALDSAPDAIVITDTAGRILFANSQVTALLGYQPAEIVGEAIEKLLPQRLRARHVSHRGRYTAQPSVRPMGTGLDLYALRKDGTELPVEISLSPIRGGGSGLTAAALRDASERRRTQAELIEAREAADRANQAKSRFLATASHDLRQPLQALALLNGALRRMVADPGATEVLAHQDQAIGAMSRLLNALLDISKLESGAIRPEPSNFAIATLLEELQQEFAALAASKGLELKVVAAGGWAFSDRGLVGQILRNLISNAVRYTTRGSVELRCALDPAHVRILVQDTGIGIAGDQLPHIYEEFYQAGVPSSATREGYGLGLSIVRRLVALLDAKIEVRSEPGRGSTFTLELPRAVDASPQRDSQAAAAPVRRAAAVAPRVLLIDDDPAVRSATAMLLKVEGYAVLAAASLAEAVAHARSDPQIALLVTDYHLQGGETGTQVIAAVRATLGRDLHAVLITGDTSSTVRDLGASERVHLVSKPIRADQLLELLKTLTPS